jgi:regulator of protease activity HflC (stomatin/prohibitin superfamily)
LCRLPMATFLGLAVASGLRWAGFPGAASLIERAITVIIALVAVELILRSIVRWLTPAPSTQERRSHADSALAGMLRLQRPDLKVFGTAVSEQLGIDLSRSWALRFIRRAALPAVLCLALFSWLLTGVSALGVGERALYEVLGRPAGVLGPGLHVHLPWPLGILRPIDFGTVHEIPIVFGTDAGAPAEAEAAAQPSMPAIEAEPPPSSDRLWDATHPSEASYLVASNSNGRQNFEVINIDLRVLYRIGMSDEAAQQANYNITSPEEVIRAAAGSMLARYFARYTVLDILGQNREAFIRGFQRELQSRLASLSSGIDVLGIVVEAIHPPPGAAAAYQGVQTATIRSVVQIAEARAEAVETVNSAKGSATTVRNEATAAAAERVDAAKGELALFEGDLKAYNTGGKAFLFERRLQHVDRALFGTPFTILDHRINGTNAPLLDLRPPSAAPYIPTPPSEP